MNDYFLIISSVVIFIAFSVGYHKISKIEECSLKTEKRLLKVEMDGGIRGESNANISKVAIQDSNLSKRAGDLDELKKLKDYIAGLKVSTTFIQSCLKKIESEIDVQEYIYFRELGEDTYKNSRIKT